MTGELAFRETRIRDAVSGLFGVLVTVAVGVVAFAAWANIWLAILVGIVVGGVATALVGLVAWLVAPYPVDVNAFLGGPDDVFWAWRESRGWLRFAAWVNRYAAQHGRAGVSGTRP